MKTKQVYIFAGVPYYDIGGGQRSAQLAKTFNKMGYLVTYVHAYDSFEYEKARVPVQAYRHLSLKELKSRDIRREITPWAVMIFEIPHRDFLPYLRFGREIGIKTVYEHIDNWESSLGNLFYDPKVLTEFLQKADLITVTSKLLRLQIYGHIKKNLLFDSLRKVVYCPNAADNELFDPSFPLPRPGDLVKAKKTLLYYGSLWGDWFDWDLIAGTARETPNCAINIIGDYKKLKEKTSAMPGNVYFLGPKKQMELPAYLYYSDYALLPFKNTAGGRYVSPLKIFEYIAMGKQVLSTALPDIKGYPNVLTGMEANEWVAAINNNPGTIDPTPFILENSWYSRCSLILKKVGLLQHPFEKISVIILNHKNKDIISKCIDSLLAFKRFYGYEIIIVDNNSRDGSPEYLGEKYGRKVKVVNNRKNGCSSGRNLGVDRAFGDILVFLDSDQWVLGERWLDAPLEILRYKRWVGAVGWTAGWHRCTVNRFPNRGIGFDLLYRRDIGYLGTGGMVVPKYVFAATKGFDEEYDPTGYEDTDFCLKIRNLGLELAYCPHISVQHLPHQTTRVGSSRYAKLLHDNGKYFRKKWKKKNRGLLEDYYRKPPDL